MSEQPEGMPESLYIKIEMSTATGQVSVSGHMANEMWFDFMIKKAVEAATDLRKKSAEQAARQAIVLPNGNIPNLRGKL